SQRVPDVSEEELQALVDRMRDQADYVSVFCAVHDLVADKYGKRRWVEKTPIHVFYVDDIVRSVRDAVFVEVVRDPRDILASKKTRRGRANLESRSRGEGGRIRNLALAYDPILDAVSWKSAVRAGGRAAERYSDRFHRLRYEDLLSDPEGCVRNLCAFLKLPFESDMLKIPGKGGAEWEKHQDKIGVDPSRAGRWKRVLSPWEIAACQSVGGEEMVRHGYELASVSRRWRLAEPLLWLRSAGSIMWRLSSKWRLGGRRYFINVVGNWRQRWKALRIG
ncbi:MAG: sulfotransferase, partial [Gemmatimonadota bacterium]